MKSFYKQFKIHIFFDVLLLMLSIVFWYVFDDTNSLCILVFYIITAVLFIVILVDLIVKI